MTKWSLYQKVEFEMIKSAEEFVTLRESEIEEEYHQAAHDEAPMDVWLDVIDRYPDMKEWVAHNKTVPLKILEILSEDIDDDVRYSVAEKRKLSFDLFEKLSEDACESVRMRIACNAKSPAYILKKLLNDKSSRIVEHVRGRLA